MRVVRLAMMLIASVVTTVTFDAVPARADAVSDCAAAQGKAAAAFFADLYKEAARACGQGSVGAPVAISEGAVGTLAGKLYAKIGKAVDKHGAPSCFFDFSAVGTPQSMLDTIRTLANAACLVP